MHPLFQFIIYFSKSFLSSFSFYGFKGQGDKVCDRSGEILLIQGPFSPSPHMFVTDHANGLSSMANWSIQHGGNPEDIQIPHGKFFGPGIDLGIMSGECETFIQSLKIYRILGRRKKGILFMFLRSELEQIDASNACPMFIINPDTHSFHFKRLGNGLSHSLQGGL